MSLFEHFETSAESSTDKSSKFSLERIQFDFPGEIISIETSNNFLAVALKHANSANSILRIDLEKIDAIEGN